MSQISSIEKTRCRFEQELILNCAPTLASLKTANLYSYKIMADEPLQEELAEVNQKLNPKGVFVEQLVQKENFTLLYVYRPAFLEKDLMREGAEEILQTYGYNQITNAHSIAYLKQRLREYECFPHEIGLFLGYPIEDVRGFILHQGKNYKCSGCWKVYCNECEAIRLFDRYKKCVRVYNQVFSEGRSIVQMTVAV